MVMQATAEFVVGGWDPGAANMATAPPPPTSTYQDETADLKMLAAGCFTIRPGLEVIGMCLPIAWSLLSENF